MEEDIKQLARNRSVMPLRLDRRVCIELAYHRCDLFVREVVPPTHVREITHDPYIFSIWRKLPHDMMSLMHHVVDSLNII